jgi:hypothetical protein
VVVIPFVSCGTRSTRDWVNDVLPDPEGPIIRNAVRDKIVLLPTYR